MSNMHNMSEMQSITNMQNMQNMYNMYNMLQHEGLLEEGVVQGDPRWGQRRPLCTCQGDEHTMTRGG